jgi:hypothetical protein
LTHPFVVYKIRRSHSVSVKRSTAHFYVRTESSNPTFWSRVSTLSTDLSAFLSDRLKKLSEHPAFSLRQGVAQGLRIVNFVGSLNNT